MIDIEFDDTTRKTKLVVKLGNKAIRFDEKSFFSPLSGFTPGWDCKHYNGYISQKIINLKSTNRIHLKTDVIDGDGSILSGVRHPILYSFVSDKPSGYRVFCELETIYFIKINKYVLNTITFYLENHNNEQVNFNGETLILL